MASEWKMVPVEPTEAMIDAVDNLIPLPKEYIAEVYAAMIGAAPQPITTVAAEIVRDICEAEPAFGPLPGSYPDRVKESKAAPQPVGKAVQAPHEPWTVAHFDKAAVPPGTELFVQPPAPLPVVNQLPDAPSYPELDWRSPLLGHCNSCGHWKRGAAHTDGGIVCPDCASNDELADWKDYAQQLRALLTQEKTNDK